MFGLVLRLKRGVYCVVVDIVEGLGLHKGQRVSEKIHDHRASMLGSPRSGALSGMK